MTSSTNKPPNHNHNTPEISGEGFGFVGFLLLCILVLALSDFWRKKKG